MTDLLAPIRAQAQGRSMDREFSRLYRIMSSRSFRHGTATGGEEPYYVYDYPASLELEVRERIRKLANDLQKIPASGDDYAPKVLQIDLYDVALAILEERGILERLVQAEPGLHANVSDNMQTDRFLRLLDPIVGADTRQVPRHIADLYRQARECNEADIIFVTGVGEVYPYMRAHTVLENLQGLIDDCPLVLFYPGVYTQGSRTGSSLELFGALEANNYYRARSLRAMTPPEQQQ